MNKEKYQNETIHFQISNIENTLLFGYKSKINSFELELEEDTIENLTDFTKDHICNIHFSTHIRVEFLINTIEKEN